MLTPTSSQGYQQGGRLYERVDVPDLQGTHMELHLPALPGKGD